ncbi:HD domain-containing protein [Gordonia sp. NPDC003424]
MSEAALTCRYLTPDQESELIARWSQPHRRYHTLAHLNHILGSLDELRTAGTDFEDEPVVLAAWFHDAIYEIPGTDNEARSAKLAASVLTDRDCAHEVARLVTVTATHVVHPGDDNAAALCDADLAILGSDTAAYDTYQRQVREEYCAIPEEAYRLGRVEVLEALLRQERLFHTRVGYDRWESKARNNIRAEIAALRVAFGSQLSKGSSTGH